MLPDSEIAEKAEMRPIAEIALQLGIPADSLELYGKYKAKIPLEFLAARRRFAAGKLILVTAVSPTPAGEGKTTVTIGLAQALRRLRYKAAVALREPSLGPVMGQKGGATGGGYAQIMPMAEINLHFTGDMHAITAAHNLLAALLDNHLHHGNALGIDVRRIVWPRALDCNDRALRHIIIGRGGKADGVPRETGFMITAASEVMAIVCLSRDYADMSRRLARIIVAYTQAGRPIIAGDLKAAGAMSALLREALKPNLAQSLEQTPAFVHGGPFANIAHGCNSILATELALKTADYAVTEAGFGADLGAEKFFDIVCPTAGFKPAAAVLVATVRALKYNGGAAKADLGREDLAALAKGSANLRRHIGNLQKFGVPVLVAVNSFATDTAAEMKLLQAICADLGVQAVPCRVFAEGGKGGEALARAVVKTLAKGESRFKPLYAAALPLKEKIATVAREIYGAAAVEYSAAAEKALADYTAQGYGSLPVCIAKTQYSFSDNPKQLGAPQGFTLQVKRAELRAGAGFIVVYAGDILTMPGLPKQPLAEQICLNAAGKIESLS